MIEKIKIYKSLVYILLLVIIGSSCIKNETCLPANNTLTAEIYNITDTTELALYKVDSLSLFISGREDTLYKNVKSINSFSIPMADTAKELILVIHLNDGHDTIWIDYTPYKEFRSTECGIINKYLINSVNSSHDKIEVISVNNNQIDESEEINLLLLYRAI